MAGFTSRGFFILAILCIGLIGCIKPVSGYGGGGTIYVKQHQKIQDALNRAHHGDRIIVEKGTYYEQLSITQDGITLVGHGATLMPPSHPKHNICSGLAGPDKAGKDSQAGICIHGYGIELGDFPKVNGEHRKVLKVKRRVKDVTVIGFTVTGFTGLNIAVVGAEGAVVTKNTLSNGLRYGSLTVGSKNSRIVGNVVLSTLPDLLFIAICMDDVSTVKVSNNDVSGYVVGLCVQTNGADVCDNDVHNCCVGAFIDPKIDGAQVKYNRVGKANPLCADPTNGSFGAYGVLISGAINSIVKHNTIDGQMTGNPAVFSAGIAVFNNTFPEVDVPKGNKILKNILSNNDVDIIQFPVDTQNTYKGNVCKSTQMSFPDGLCAA